MKAILLMHISRRTQAWPEAAKFPDIFALSG